MKLGSTPVFPIVLIRTKIPFVSRKSSLLIRLGFFIIVFGTNGGNEIMNITNTVISVFNSCGGLQFT